MARTPRLMPDHILHATIDTYLDTQKAGPLSPGDTRRLALLLTEQREREQLRKADEDE